MHNKKYIEKSFREWRRYDVEMALAVARLPHAAAFEDWLRAPGEVPDGAAIVLENLRLKLEDYHNDWNEMEIIFHFIAPLINTLNFGNKYYTCFAERKLKAHLKNYCVEGIVDWMAALGSYEPRRPYFFIHEYKRTQQTDSDPLGQLLITMLAAQALNADGLPIYGAYVWGRYWYFVWVMGDAYTVSETYDAVKADDLKQIWLILNKTKFIVESRAEQAFAAEWAQANTDLE